MVEVIITAPTQARRDWLANAVRGESTIHLAGAAATFPFLRSLLTETAADVVLVDSGWRPQSEVTRDWLFELFDVVPIVLFSSDVDIPTFHRMLQAEGGGMLRPDAGSEHIIRAVKAAADGLLIFDSTLVPHRDIDDGFREDLTPRETEVLQLLAEGLANREIAARLNISDHTIKFHIRSILGKLGASTRTQAVTRGFRNGLIEL